MGDRIQVPLELSSFEVVGTELVEGRLEVTVASTFPRACYHCGSTDVIGHGRCRRRLRDRAHGYPTTLVWEQRRYRCRDCGRTSRERHPETLGAKRVTARFRSALAGAACSQPWSDVAYREHGSWWRVADAFEARAAGFDPFTGPAPRVVSLDEASFRSRLVFHTVLSAPEQHRILELVEGRNRPSAIQAIAGMPFLWQLGIETVVIDMSWPYRKAIEHALPWARIVADKFHVIGTVDAAAQKVRIRHGRRITVVGRDGGLARQHNPRFNPKMWRSRWAFMRRADKLNPIERAGLDQLFELHREVGGLLAQRSLRPHLPGNQPSREHRLDLWVHHVHQAGIPELISTWTNLQWWREPVLNYFDDPQTNAYAEGITNKIKVLKRRGYGHRNPHHYRNKVLAITPHQPAEPPPIA